ncbi:MAG: sigma factor-like helix-turn-helix DNA-binding protein [Bryobacteraceae bacterium]
MLPSRKLRADGNTSAETELLRSADRESLRKCLEELPQDFREAIVLRELEGMSYRQIGYCEHSRRDGDVPDCSRANAWNRAC